VAIRTSAGAALRTIANGFMITGAIAGLAGLVAIVGGFMAWRQERLPQPVGAGTPAVKS
jgi:hypothetical protein